MAPGSAVTITSEGIITKIGRLLTQKGPVQTCMSVCIKVCDGDIGLVSRGHVVQEHHVEVITQFFAN